jgi:hypothetical protein
LHEPSQAGPFLAARKLGTVSDFTLITMKLSLLPTKDNALSNKARANWLRG